MVYGHKNGYRKFKPMDNPGGGSEKGKPQNYWPIGLLVIADAVCRRVMGGMEASVHDRGLASAGIDSAGIFLKNELDRLCPGVWDWTSANFQPTKTPSWELLRNRFFKGSTYNGTSARGRNHDPRTRAGPSREFWINKVPEGHYLRDIHEDVYRGRVQTIRNWKRKLLVWERDLK